MPEPGCIALKGLDAAQSPFPHFSSLHFFNGGLENRLFAWFEQAGLWGLTETDFYTQYEFSVLEAELPEDLQCLVSDDAINTIANCFSVALNATGLQIAGITAHKLVHGHRMGVHNDYIGTEETHRLIIQIAPQWKEENGGYLMFFNSRDPQDVAQVICPLNNTAIGFEISPDSYHAVSTVYDYCRYTLVYTFNRGGKCN